LPASPLAPWLGPRLCRELAAIHLRSVLIPEHSYQQGFAAMKQELLSPPSTPNMQTTEDGSSPKPTFKDVDFVEQEICF
jgi:hypothetical protein